jgi:hypothetical protein
MYFNVFKVVFLNKVFKKEWLKYKISRCYAQVKSKYFIKVSLRCPNAFKYY